MLKSIVEFFVVYSESDGSYYPTTAGNITLVVLIFLLFIGMAIFSGYRRKTQAKQMAFSAAAMALALVTSLFTVMELPQGGSITLFSMFFICLIGYLYGTKVGILTGLAYGILNLLMDPYVVHPIQLLLDYPIAYGCLGLAGIFSKSNYGMVKGYTLAVLGRYICHVITGIIFFGMYAGGKNVLIYSLTYNATYIVPEAIATIIILAVPGIQSALMEVKKMALEV